MSTIRTLSFALLVASLSLGTGCARDTPAPADDESTPTTSDSEGSLSSSIAATVSEAMAEAREELAKENITISKDSTQPKAEITPQGDLLIEGTKVNVDAAQKALLLEHRQHIVAIAHAGMEIGAQGADLAGKAVTEALAGVFSGNADEIEKKVEAEARKIEASAKKLCGLLPAMLASQEKLKTAVPEFAPYARMTQSDVDDCDKDGHFSN